MADISSSIQTFLDHYDCEAQDEIWQDLSRKFRHFWNDRILAAGTDPISDAHCDEVIRILDRNAKGNTKSSEAVAKAMIPQGAWRRMLNEFHGNHALGQLMDLILNAGDPRTRAGLIDQLYEVNAGQGNHLTGPSGNAVGAYLAAYDPSNNLSIVSLKDRRAIIEHFGFPVSFDWESASIGTRMVETNRDIIEGCRRLGVAGSARTMTCFFYFPDVKMRWKDEHTVRLVDRTVNVAVPVFPDEEEVLRDGDVVRQSMRIQGLLAKIGTLMGFAIWLPASDRSRVLKVWQAQPGELVDELPLGYDPSTIKTIEQIDVLWLRKRSIVRAFEVEHTTSIYSGLLRMADLVALQPNINIKLHIVAPVEKRDKVLQEILRPVFSLLEGRALSDMCTYLSYDSIQELSELKHLAHLSDKVLEDYEEAAE